MTELSRQRIDKWLWHARVTKTRSLAQKLVSAGKVRIDGKKVHNSSDKVKPGDVLTITLPGSVKVLRIAGLADRRGSFPVASQLYEDLSPAIPRRTETVKDQQPTVTPVGRPDKRERRKAVVMKQSRHQ